MKNRSHSYLGEMSGTYSRPLYAVRQPRYSHAAVSVVQAQGTGHAFRSCSYKNEPTRKVRVSTPPMRGLAPRGNMWTPPCLKRSEMSGERWMGRTARLFCEAKRGKPQSRYW